MAATNSPEKNSEAPKLKVFVSYSRADAKFADELVAGLEFDGGFDISIDRRSIEKGEDWQARLGKLIEAADTIVFVLSPASATSDICLWEVEHAAALNKRILPVLHLPLGNTAAPPALGKINYVDFTTAPTLISGIRDLASALKTDLVWLREGTRLLNLALDWDRAGKRDNRLLSGPDIVEAKKWLADCPASETPTELHRNFIRASEEAEVIRLDAARVQLAELAAAQQEAAASAKRATSRTVEGSLVALLLAALVAGSVWFASGRQRAAEATSREEQIAQSRLLALSAQSVFERSKGGASLLGMLLALEGMPDAASDDPRQASRPRVIETQVQLDLALRADHELAVIPQFGWVTAVAWSPDSKYLATGSWHGEARIVEAETGRELMQEMLDHIVWAVAWSPNGKYFATGSGNLMATRGVTRISEWGTGNRLAFVLHESPVRAVSWSPDGKNVATSCAGGPLRILEATTGKELMLLVHDGFVYDLAWSPDGRFLATGLLGGEAQIFKAKTGRELLKFVHDGSVNDLAWSPDGRWLATGSEDKTARIIDAESGKELARVTHGGGVTAVAWSADGRWLATGSRDKTACIIGTASGKKLIQLVHDGSVTALAWSPDGRWLATGSEDKTARIIEAASGKELARVTHGDAVTAVAWSPDGRRLATGSEDETVRIIETATRIEQAEVTYDELISTRSDGHIAGTWPVFNEPQALVDAAKERAARCLTQGERAQYFLPAAPPTWCVERRLWPYHTDAWQQWLPMRKAWLAAGRDGPEPDLPKD